MAQSYIALIRKDPDTDYWIDIPDIPGLVASGDTTEQAKANFKEALDAHLEAMAGYGLLLTPPRTAQAVLSAETETFIDSYNIEVDFP